MSISRNCPHFCAHTYNHRCHSQVSQLEREIEEARRQLSASKELSLTTDDIKNFLLDNPEVIDAATWKALALKSPVVKSVVVGDGQIAEEKGGEGGKEVEEVEERNEEKDFCCKETKKCSRAFKTAKGLGTHIKEYHQGKKNYICSTCGKQFLTVKTLKKHEKVHLKPDVICDQCGVQKRDEFRMKQHKQQEHEEGKGRCERCGVDCGTRAALRGHLKSCLQKLRRVGRMQVQVACNFVILFKKW